MTSEVKLMWYAMGFNVAVSMMNLGFCINYISSSNWSSAATSGVLTVLNAVVAGFLFTRLREYKQREKQRVADILSGRYDDNTNDVVW